MSSTTVKYEHSNGPFLATHRVIFERNGPDGGNRLQTLLELLKIGRNWNSTAKSELDPDNIDEVIRQIQKES